VLRDLERLTNEVEALCRQRKEDVAELIRHAVRVRENRLIMESEGRLAVLRDNDPYGEDDYARML
jgi:hypothetical protein